MAKPLAPPQLKDYENLNQPYRTPDPKAWTSYQKEIYSALRAPAFSTDPLHWETLARKKVPAGNFDYVGGSASSELTYSANIAAFRRYRLRPRMLVDATVRDTSIEIFGRKHHSPLVVAPIGVQGIMHRDAEEATARACKNLDMPMILSSAATRSIEQVAEANGDGDRWFQLYWPRPQNEEITASFLQRAKASGYRVLVVTLDTFSLGWRPKDLDKSYLPFVWGQGFQIGLSDPVFNKRFDEASGGRSASETLKEIWDLVTRPGTVSGAARILSNLKTMAKSKALIEVLNSGTYRKWEHLEILKKLWDGPIVLKGIQSVEDAHLAIEYGMSGIVVSNHGGRQLDGAIASLDALAEITADLRVKRSGLTVLFDSGVRTGSDVLKAMALGAKAVLIGRPYVYGLAIDGQKGVEHVLKCLLADTDNSLANMGKKSLQDLSRSDLQIVSESKL